MPPWVRYRTSPDRGDQGLTLIEVIVALAIIAGVMAAAGVFFISSLKNTGLQSQRSVAVSLANQGLEAVQAIQPGKLLEGRTALNVDALNTSASPAQLVAQDVTGSNNFDPLATVASTEVVPITRTAVVNSVSYTIRTFINSCYLTADQNTCDKTQPAGSIRIYRATVAVTWVPAGGLTCSGGCLFSASTLIDTQTDPRFNTNISHPSITSISPSSVVAGSNRTITINGTAFANGATVTITPGGGSFGTVTLNTGTQITVPLAVGNTPGTYTVDVANPDGGHATTTITVTPAPTITSVAPSSVVGTSTRTITLNGTGFVSGATVSIASGGGTVGSAAFVSSTQLTFTLTAGNATGGYAVTVTNPDGSNATSTVTVTSPPSIASVAPSLVGTSSRTVTITGTGFVAGAAVTLAAGGGTITSVTYVSTTQLTANVTASATAGSYAVTVTNTDGSNATGSLTVTAPPAITSVSPASIARKVLTTVTLTGTGFQVGAGVSFATGTVTVTSLTSTSIVVQVTSTVGPGTGTFTVTNPDGSTVTSGSVAITATNPNITSVVQSAVAKVGAATTVTLNGTGFVSGAGWGVTASAGTVNSFVFVSNIKVTVNYTPAGVGGAGINFTLTNFDGIAASRTGTITVLAPTVTSLAPTSVPRNVNATFTIIGTGFASGATVTITTNSWTNPTATTYVSSTQLTAVTKAPNIGQTKTVLVTVTNPDGQTGTKSVSVTIT